jgi:hypothetical protein
MKKNLILIISLVFLFATISAFANEAFEPNLNPELKVEKLNGQIKIDGDLNDTGWKSAARGNMGYDNL